MSQSDTLYEEKNFSIEENLKKCIIAEPVTDAKKKTKKKKKSNPSSSTGFAFNNERANLVKISTSSEKGRSLIANTSIKAGTLFFSELPIATLAHNKGLCSHCNKPITVKESKTNIALDFEIFCTTECLEAFSVNTEKLKYFHALDSVVKESARKNNCDIDLLRIVFKIFAYYLFEDNTDVATSVPNNVLCTDIDGQLQATLCGINSLEAHLSQQSSSWIHSVTNSIRAVLEGLQVQGIINFEQYDLIRLPVLEAIPPVGTATTSTGTTATATTSATTIVSVETTNILEKLTQSILFFACIINVNAYGIVDYTADTNGSLGFGLFPTVGLCLNHSCHPNSYYTFNPILGCMEYRTLYDIQKNEELSVSYIDIFDTTNNRRDNIEKLRFFRCNCIRCLGYDQIEAIVHNINTTTSSSTVANNSSNSNNKKKNNKKDETTTSNGGITMLQEISPFYTVPAAGCALDAWIEDEFGSAGTITNDSSKGSKGKKKAKSSSSITTTTTTTTASTVTQTNTIHTMNNAETLAKTLADAKLNAFYCETCGERGAVIAVGNLEEAACLVCATKMDWKNTEISRERCSNQWNVCQETVRCSAQGSPAIMHIEKFLQEADPEYMQYANCSNNLTAVYTTPSVHLPQSAQAIAAERRRRTRCPMQLHPNHRLLVHAYDLLYEHLQEASYSSVEANLIPRSCYALRRIIKSRSSLFAPVLHPEVGAIQYRLVQLLMKEMKKHSMNATNKKILQQECKTLLEQVIRARTHAFGTDHIVTKEAKDLLQLVQ